jgi:hypothetical protein
MMNRRNFLKFVAGSAVVAATGLPETLKAVPITESEFVNDSTGEETVYRIDFENPVLLDTTDLVRKANVCEYMPNHAKRWRLGDHCYIRVDEAD